MTYLTLTAKTAQTSGRDGFGIFALALSLGLVMLGLFSVEYPRPGAATGDPFLFVMKP